MKCLKRELKCCDHETDLVLLLVNFLSKLFQDLSSSSWLIDQSSIYSYQ